GAEPSTAEPSLLGNVLELAIAQVVIEHVAVVACHEQIQLAVVIVVGDGHAHSPAQPGQTGFLGDVLESPVRLLVIKSNHGIAALAQPLNSRAIHQDDIQPVIVVAVKQADAATGGINNVM